MTFVSDPTVPYGYAIPDAESFAAALECDCGICRRCERVMFPPPTITDEIRERARAAIEQLDQEPEHAPKPATKIRSAATRTRVRGESRPAVVKAPPVTERVECSTCGQARAYTKAGARGQWLTGRNGMCEVCHDKPALTEKLRAHETGEKVLTSHMLRSTRKHLERELRDGRAYHPGARHGQTSSYGTWGCRCAECCEAKATYLAEFRERTGYYR